MKKTPIQKAAAILAAQSRKNPTEAQKAASRANGVKGAEHGAKGGRPRKAQYAPTYHRDGSITYWSVYQQRWVRSSTIPDDELAAQSADRERIMRHLGI